MVFQKLVRIALLYFSLPFSSPVEGDDITDRVFGSYKPGIPAAFGDFNADGWTDLFTIRQEGTNSSVEILLGSSSEPVLQPGEKLSCTFKNLKITNVIPGNFNADIYMDVLVAGVKNGDNLTYVYLLEGAPSAIKCANEKQFSIKMKSQPIAVDYNKDMITDLFGENEHGVRVFWVFSANVSTGFASHYIPLDPSGSPAEAFRSVHSNAFIDLNQDGDADLYITYRNNTEYWYRDTDSLNFTKHESLAFPSVWDKSTILGQTTFLDIQSTGELFQLIPSCDGNSDGIGCTNSRIHVVGNVRGSITELRISFHEETTNRDWSFAYNRSADYYLNAITLRVGDFNLDGFPDLLATLSPEDDPSVAKTFLLENIKCTSCPFQRRFNISWNASISSRDDTILGVFYDFFQDGSLNVLSVQRDYQVAAFQTADSMNYDVNFLKVTVIPSKKHDLKPRSLFLKDRKIHGTNLPGPTINCASESIVHVHVNVRHAQMPQSAHFSLNLPYVLCGFGRLEDRIQKLIVHFRGDKRTWEKVIPNANIIVIPDPMNKPAEWQLSQFIPRERVLYLVAGLIGPCFLLAVTVAFLQWKEVKEDKKETLRQPHRFIFNAI